MAYTPREPLNFKRDKYVNLKIVLMSILLTLTIALGLYLNS